MFIVSAALKNIRRHSRRALLYLLICTMAVLALQVYISAIDHTSALLVQLGETMPIYGQVANIDASRYDSLQIREATVKGLLASEQVSDLNITVHLRAAEPGTEVDENGRSLSSPPWFMMGANCLAAPDGLARAEISRLPGWGPDCLSGSEKVCLADETFLAERGLALGDILTVDLFRYAYGQFGNLRFEQLGTQELCVVGVLDNSAVRNLPDAILPFQTLWEIHAAAGRSLTAASANFYLRDPVRLNEFKDEMSGIMLAQADLTGGQAQAAARNVGTALLLDDATYITGATRLRESLDLLNAFLPVIIVVLAVIGYFVAYLMVQSRANEYAVLRLLGLGKGRSVGMYFLEMTVLTLAGALVGLLLALVFGIVSSVGSALGIFALFVVCFLLGSLIALWRLSRVNVMLALSRAD